MVEKKSMQVTEKQIAQMAQQEEQIILQKQQLLGNFTEHLKETIGAIDSLEGIQEQNGNMLIKLGAGVLIEASITAKTCIRSFAEDGYREEKITDAIKKLEKRRDNLEKQANHTAKEIYERQSRLTQLIGLIQQIESEKKKNFSMSSKK